MCIRDRPLGQLGTHLACDRASLAGDRSGAPRQLVARVVDLAGATHRGPAGGAQAAGQQASPRDRSRAWPIRQAQSLKPARHKRVRSLQRSVDMTDIVIVAAARTAVGKFGGTLAKTPASELGAVVIRDPVSYTHLRAHET